jgi:hypothetical protein
MLLWGKYGVNYSFIFEFDLRNHWDYASMFEAAAGFTILWSASLFIYCVGAVKPAYFEWVGDIPWQVHPLIYFFGNFGGKKIVINKGFLGVTVLYQIKSAWWVSRTVLRVAATPFVQLRFRDLFMADQLLSIVIVAMDIEYTTCFFLYDAWSGSSKISK